MHSFFVFCFLCSYCIIAIHCESKDLSNYFDKAVEKLKQDPTGKKFGDHFLAPLFPSKDQFETFLRNRVEKYKSFLNKTLDVFQSIFRRKESNQDTAKKDNPVNDFFRKTLASILNFNLHVKNDSTVENLKDFYNKTIQRILDIDFKPTEPEDDKAVVKFLSFFPGLQSLETRRENRSVVVKRFLASIQRLIFEVSHLPENFRGESKENAKNKTVVERLVNDPRVTKAKTPGEAIKLGIQLLRERLKIRMSATKRFFLVWVLKFTETMNNLSENLKDNVENDTVYEFLNRMSIVNNFIMSYVEKTAFS